MWLWPVVYGRRACGGDAHATPPACGRPAETGAVRRVAAQRRAGSRPAAAAWPRPVRRAILPADSPNSLPRPHARAAGSAAANAGAAPLTGVAAQRCPVSAAAKWGSGGAAALPNHVSAHHFTHRQARTSPQQRARRRRSRTCKGSSAIDRRRRSAIPQPTHRNRCRRRHAADPTTCVIAGQSHRPAHGHHLGHQPRSEAAAPAPRLVMGPTSQWRSAQGDEPKGAGETGPTPPPLSHHPPLPLPLLRRLRPIRIKVRATAATAAAASATNSELGRLQRLWWATVAACPPQRRMLSARHRCAGAGGTTAARRACNRARSPHLETMRPRGDIQADGRWGGDHSWLRGGCSLRLGCRRHPQPVWHHRSATRRRRAS